VDHSLFLTNTTQMTTATKDEDSTADSIEAWVQHCRCKRMEGDAAARVLKWAESCFEGKARHTGPQPIAANRQDLMRVMGAQRKDWLMSIKLDGFQLLVLQERSGTRFAVDRQDRVWQFPDDDGMTDEEKDRIVLVGEVTCERNDAGERCYVLYPFDMVDGIDTTFGSKQRLAEIDRRRLELERRMPKGLRLGQKPFVAIDEWRTLFRHLFDDRPDGDDGWMYRPSSSKEGLPVDGLIFQRGDASRAFEGGALLKFKLVHTLDLAVDYLPEFAEALLYYHEDHGERKLVDRQPWPKQRLPPPAVDGKDASGSVRSAVVECVLSVKGEWTIKKFRKDKTRPNAAKVIRDTRELIKNAPSVEDVQTWLKTPPASPSSSSSSSSASSSSTEWLTLPGPTSGNGVNGMLHVVDALVAEWRKRSTCELEIRLLDTPPLDAFTQVVSMLATRVVPFGYFFKSIQTSSDRILQKSSRSVLRETTTDETGVKQWMIKTVIAACDVTFRSSRGGDSFRARVSLAVEDVQKSVAADAFLVTDEKSTLTCRLKERAEFMPSDRSVRIHCTKVRQAATLERCSASETPCVYEIEVEAADREHASARTIVSHFCTVVGRPLSELECSWRLSTS
jgi:hypothetical protein